MCVNRLSGVFVFLVTAVLGQVALGQMNEKPADLLARAKAATADPEKNVVILEEYAKLRLDGLGRQHTHVRRVYHIRNEKGVDGWSTVSVSYTPWYQQRPVVRGRVVTADGREHRLDPATLNDTPAIEYDKDIYSDRRILAGPLPAVAGGAVVEWEYELTETAPFFSSGTVTRWGLAAPMPTMRTRFELEAPESLGLKVQPRLLEEGALVRTVQQGVVSWRLELSPGPKWVDELPLLPAEVKTNAGIGFATGRSWKAVATEYARLVDRQVRGADIKALGLVVEGVGADRTREQVIDELVRRIHKQVRYVGIELGDGSIVPRTPAEVAGKKYGDCKDKAALLVAALRAVGIEAYVALLNAAYGEDVDTELPGLGMFNHAIAYVPGGKPLWIDMTVEDARLGTLPRADQGRLALIASAETDALTKIPVARMEENWFIYTRELFLRDPGKARVEETIEAGGASELAMRQVYAGDETKEMRDALKSYAQGLLADEPKLLEHPLRHDFNKPFRMKWEAARSGRGVVDRAEAVAAILPAFLLSDLDYWFKMPEEKDKTSEDAETQAYRHREEKRREDFVVRAPYSGEIRYIVHPPRNFRAKPLPESGVEELGPARLEQKYAVRADGTVLATLRFEMAKARLSVEEGRALRAKASEFVQRGAILLGFVHEAEEEMALGKVKEAIEKLRSAVEAEPGKAIHHSRLARAYLQVGLGRLARESARKGTEAEVDSKTAYLDLAFVLQHNLTGQHFQPGFDRAGAIKALERAVELDKGDWQARAELAIVYEHDEDGERYSARGDLDKAIELYKKMGANLASSGIDQNYPLILLMAGRFQEVAGAAEKIANQGLARLLVNTAMAARQGPSAAILATQRDVADAATRAQTLQSISATLVQLRRYPEAAEVLRALLRLAPNTMGSKRAELLAKTRRSEDVKVDETQVEAPVRKLMQLMFSREFRVEELAVLFVDSELAKAELEAARESLLEIRRPMLAAVRRARAQGVTLDVMRDLLVAGLEYTKEGNEERGYRVTTKSVMDESKTGTFYVVKRDGRYLLAGGGSDMETAARQARQYLDGGKLDAAQIWLDWIVKDLSGGGDRDEIALPVVRYLWSGVGDAGRNQQAARVAIAACMAPKLPNNTSQIEVLKQALAQAKIGKDRIHILAAMAQGYQKAEKWNELTATARQLIAAAPKSSVAFELLTTGLIRGGKLEEARTAAQARLRTVSQTFQSNVAMEDEAALRVLARVAFEKKNWKEASELFDRLAVQQNHKEPIKAEAIWLRLRAGNLEGKLPFELAEDQGGEGSLAQAVLLASTGQVVQARSRYLEYINATGGGATPKGPECVVMARIAEYLGEKTEAKRYLEMVKPAEPDAAIAEQVAASLRLTP